MSRITKMENSKQTPVVISPVTKVVLHRRHSEQLGLIPAEKIRRHSLLINKLSLGGERKKALTEPKPQGTKRRRSPAPSNRTHLDTSASATKPRHKNVSASDLAALSTGGASDGHHSQDDLDVTDLSTMTMATNGGSSSDPGNDEPDAHPVDPNRTKQAIDHLQAKIRRIMEQIKEEQNAKEENVNEYLRLSNNSNDKQQAQRIKTVFEKKNQKSTQLLAQLQRKLENYQRKLKDVETYGVTGHKKAKEMLQDVGQGLKDVGANIRDGITGLSEGVVDNIRGAKDTIVSKPKEIAYRFKNKFGSADNISSLKTLEDSQGSAEEGERHSHHGSGLSGGNTLPQNFKYEEPDNESLQSSGSVPSGFATSGPNDSLTPATGTLDNYVPIVVRELRQQHRDLESRMRGSMENVQALVASDVEHLKTAMEEERFRREQLEEQINDLTDLHQHEISNIKQELAGMEEKMEYQLEERTRDMQELLEKLQNRIVKQELQQQQQQLISMEGIDNTNFRALITKLINVLLAVLAVILVFVSTIANLLGPFLTTRLRILTTICLIAFIVATWQNWHHVQDLFYNTRTRFFSRN